MEQNDKSFVGLAKPGKSRRSSDTDVFGSTQNLQARDGAAW